MNKRTCKTCGRQWPYKHALRKAWRVKTSLACPYCQTPQYMTARSRMRSGTYAVMVMVAIIIVRLFVDLDVIQSVVLSLSFFMVMFLLYPFTIDLTDKEQRFV